MSKQVPKEWSVVSLSEIAKVKTGNNKLTKSSYIPHGYPAFSGSGQDGYCAHFEHHADAIVVASVGARCGKGYLAQGRWTAIANTTLVFPDLTKTDLRFIYESIKDENTWNKSGGAQPFVSVTEIESKQLLLPPLKEQQKIAEILTAVDEVIENTQSQINKLEDLKKATMNKLLTKGISHTEFKDTKGGKIPKSWTLSRLEDVTERIWIGLVTTMTKFYSDSGVFLIRNSDIKEQGIETNDLIRLESNFANSFEDRKLRFNDVATVHTGDVGTSCVISESLDGAHGFATLNSRVTRARIFPNYYAMYLNSELFRRQTKKVVTGDGRDNLNLKDFLQLQIPVPDTLEEQVEIMRIYRGISDLIQGKKNKSESLNFLKHSLMHDLLTGKVRVTVN